MVARLSSLNFKKSITKVLNQTRKNRALVSLALFSRQSKAKLIESKAQASLHPLVAKVPFKYSFLQKSPKTFKFFYAILVKRSTIISNFKFLLYHLNQITIHSSRRLCRYSIQKLGLYETIY